MLWSDADPGKNNESDLLLKLFDTSLDPALIISDGRFIECNQSALNVLGYPTKADLLNAQPAEISPEFQPDGVLSHIKAERLIRDAEQNGALQFEWVHKRFDGTFITVKVTLSVLQSDIGPIIYTTWHDVSEKHFLHASLNQTETKFNALFQAINSGIVILSANKTADQYLTYSLNPTAEKIFNVEEHKVRNCALDKVLSGNGNDYSDLITVIERVSRDGKDRSSLMTRFKGHKVAQWLEIRVYRYSEDEIALVVDDFTEREQSRIDAELLANVYHYSNQSTLITDHNNQIISVNPAFEQLTGYSKDEITGKNPSILASGKSDPATYAEMWHALRTEGRWQGELWDKAKDGRVYPKMVNIHAIKGRDGAVKFHFACFSDITEEKKNEEKINFLAYHDPLTTLPNRFNFEEQLNQSLQQAKTENQTIAILFIDLDRFKDINDSLGHHIGDELLKQVGQRLRGSIRKDDLIARLGGDEFIIALHDFTDFGKLAIKTQSILDTVSEQYVINDQKLHISPSIGVSTYPNDASEVHDLLKYADAAMYHAKAMGRKNVQFFSSSISESTSKRLQLIQELYAALEKQEFVLHYQPQVDAANGELIGFEALIRWDHPQRGRIPPMDFIPLLEESGLIQPVGQWVLCEACKQLAIWREKGHEDFTMAVNISARQLHNTDFIEQVTTALDHYQIPASRLEIEVTESVAMDNPEQAVTILNELNDLGVRISIDDFGTGYSSLAYLKKLPLHTLKLDREFVKDIGSDANDEAISMATIVLAHNLGLKVVAEGVEYTQQKIFLEQNHCDVLQGFLFGGPSNAEGVERVWFSEALAITDQ